MILTKLSTKILGKRLPYWVTISYLRTKHNLPFRNSSNILLNLPKYNLN